ncbi:MAG: DHA2 family efflux MFS transporter permease subunit, partial [Myxococcales bacterium]
SIGGYLIEWFNWHWIFLVNVPIGALVAVGIWRVIEQPGFTPPTGDEAKIDKLGIGLLAVGMGTLQYVLEEGNREGWFDSTLIQALTAVAVVALITFFVHELETPHPVVDLRVFTNRSYAAGTGLNFLTGFALFSGSFLFSLYGGSVMRYTALDLGKVFLVAGTVSVFVMPAMGKLVGKVDGRLLLAIGVVVVAYSQYTAAHLTAAAGFWDLVRPNMIRSFGLGFLFIPVSVMALSDLPASQRGNATGLFNLTRELGGSVGTAVMGSLLSNSMIRHGSYVSENVTIYNPLVQEQLASLRGNVGAQAFSSELVAEHLLKLKVTLQASVLSFEQGFRLVAGAMMLGLVLVALLKKANPNVKVEGAH